MLLSYYVTYVALFVYSTEVSLLTLAVNVE